MNNDLSFMVSPQTGMCVSIVEMPDEVFSERILGDGIAVIPEKDEVLSTIDGEIATADIKMIKEKGYPLHTAMVITNGKELERMEGLYGEVVAGKDAVIKYIKKI